MQNSANKQVVVFNKAGNRYGKCDIPEMFYLETEDDWVQKQLFYADDLDGIAIKIDWINREIKLIRNEK